MTEHQLEQAIEELQLPWFEQDDCPPNEALVGWLQYFFGTDDHETIKSAILTKAIRRY